MQCDRSRRNHRNHSRRNWTSRNRSSRSFSSRRIHRNHSCCRTRKMSRMYRCGHEGGGKVTQEGGEHAGEDGGQTSRRRNSKLSMSLF